MIRHNDSKPISPEWEAENIDRVDANYSETMSGAAEFEKESSRQEGTVAVAQAIVRAWYPNAWHEIRDFGSGDRNVECVIWSGLQGDRTWLYTCARPSRLEAWKAAWNGLASIILASPG